MKDENVCQDVYYLQSPHMPQSCIANKDDYDDDDVDGGEINLEAKQQRHR